MVEEFETLSEQLARVTAECERLREENARLSNLLSDRTRPATGSQIEPLAPSNPGSAIAPVRKTESPGHPDLSVPAKVALFRSLFRGREDVYALRWESADGKSGYSPASIRDWKAVMGVPQAERKKLDQATRQLLPLTDEAVCQHLSGKNTLGIYPLLPDETCWLLAVDFDRESWKIDAVSFVESCREMNVPAALERSRSGEGVHVWIFFRAPVSATLARKLGAGLLTRTMQRRHQMSLSSYDRLFPNQDTMPSGGFGNLIALPLQKIPRRSDNSVFVDDAFDPFPDQWRYLARHPQNGTACRRAPGPQSGFPRH